MIISSAFREALFLRLELRLPVTADRKAERTAGTGMSKGGLSGGLNVLDDVSVRLKWLKRAINELGKVKTSVSAILRA